MRRSLTTAVAIAAMVLLGACSAPAGVSYSAEKEAQPAVVSTPVAKAPPAPSASDAEFLADVRERQSAFATQIPDASDEQLLALGAEACEQLAAGVDTSALSLIPGESANVLGTFNDSAAVITSARVHLCPA
ncbi:DUF732 domain-containing protein [Microbacterium sp. E-13]|uniref:DUF732 domain-containing protein n=1 Tax=Microbacterium sp. E-13 TaxID=3404048 RepID=UPI003CEB1DF1